MLWAPIIAAAISAGGSVASGFAGGGGDGGGRRNPFEGQLAQGDAMARLDFIENASYSKPRFSGATQQVGRAQVPLMEGGFSYERSPEVREGAGRLKRDVMSGRHGNPMDLRKNAKRRSGPTWLGQSFA